MGQRSGRDLGSNPGAKDLRPTKQQWQGGKNYEKTATENAKHRHQCEHVGKLCSADLAGTESKLFKVQNTDLSRASRLMFVCQQKNAKNMFTLLVAGLVAHKSGFRRRTSRSGGLSQVLGCGRGRCGDVVRYSYTYTSREPGT